MWVGHRAGDGVSDGPCAERNPHRCGRGTCSSAGLSLRTETETETTRQAPRLPDSLDFLLKMWLKMRPCHKSVTQMDVRGGHRRS